MTAYVVFYRRLSEEQRALLNGPNGGWSSVIGTAYMSCEPWGEKPPTYGPDVIAFDLFEKAAFAWNYGKNKDVLYSDFQDTGLTGWNDSRSIACYTDFPRSMSVGDVIYEPATDEWSYVDRYGFGTVTDELFIEYLRSKISPKDFEGVTYAG